jgi:lipid-A-disaccharide synthase
MKSDPKILLSSGETSGDIHAAQLIRRLRERIPNAHIQALGGDRCADAGAELLFHYHDYAILGFTGVVVNLPKLLKLERALKARLRDGVDLFIAVDYPGLNLRLAAYAKKTDVPVLYYISPQVWAWGAGRIKKLAKSVDAMAVILPFEEDIYRRRGIPVEYVGHPFVEDHALPEPLSQNERVGVGVLPGSRAQEVERILPVMLRTAGIMSAARSDLKFTVGRSPTVPEWVYRTIVAREGVAVAFDDDAVEVMRRSRLLLVASGTATLQGALMETPLVIVYKVSAFNFFLASRLVKLQNIGLVNVILGEEVCPEFIQGNATPSRIASAGLELYEDERSRDRMCGRFKQLRGMLSGGGGCNRVAQLAAELMKAK